LRKLGWMQTASSSTAGVWPAAASAHCLCSPPRRSIMLCSQPFRSCVRRPSPGFCNLRLCVMCAQHAQGKAHKQQHLCMATCTDLLWHSQRSKVRVSSCHNKQQDPACEYMSTGSS
jgi:hypothetical protein